MLFRLHEERPNQINQSSPINGTTVIIGLFVKGVDVVKDRAIEAGAVVLTPAESYDYGYRQEEIQDPFGHIWMIEARL